MEMTTARKIAFLFLVSALGWVLLGVRCYAMGEIYNSVDCFTVAAVQLFLLFIFRNT